MSRILDVRGRQIFDSRGTPTVEADVVLETGAWGRGSVPSGASTGAYEALERRDAHQKLAGKTVQGAVDSINGEMREALIGKEIENQVLLDHLLCELDGTPNKERLGANAILGVSMAAARAAAQEKEMPLYRSLGGSFSTLLPVPLMNVVNGGCHADNALDIQEFMIVPVGASCFSEALVMGGEVFYALKRNLKAAGYPTNVGDEGGFAPNFSDPERALDFLMESIEKAGFRPGEDIGLALDVAATELYDKGFYHFRGLKKKMSGEELAAYYETLIKNYPILSIEDPFAENDWDAWKDFMVRCGDLLQIIGDDLYTTNLVRLNKGIQWGASNSILIKPNQIGTLSETVQVIQRAQKNALTCVVSHRSGETEDTLISHLAVAFNTGQIKTGSLSRTDRVAKYNELLRIEEELGRQASFLGKEAFPKTYA